LRVVSNMNDSQAIDIIYDYFLNYIIFFMKYIIFFKSAKFLKIILEKISTSRLINENIFIFIPL
jgi:hypothetical protein